MQPPKNRNPKAILGLSPNAVRLTIFVLVLTTTAIPAALWINPITHGQSAVPESGTDFGPVRRLSIADKNAVIAPQDVTELTASLRRVRRQPTQRTPGNPSEYLVLNVEFDSSQSLANFKVPGASIFAHKDKFADLFIEPKQSVFDQVRTAPGVVWIEQGPVITVPPPPARPRTLERARAEERSDEIVRGGVDGLTGKGTIIAILDSGVDFRNPDFITYDGAGQPTSRILYLWDTTRNDFDARRLGSKPPLSYPNRSSVGTLFTQAQLTAALRKERRSQLSGISETDLGGHGTACAGVAAANGNNGQNASGEKRSEVIGVAPEADIIAVRLDDESSPYFENSFLLNAVTEWLDSVAGTRPLVVSCSFGGHRGGHDGRLIVERHLDARFPQDKVGRAIVIAAGNEAAHGLHASASLDDKSRHVISWQASPGGAQLEIYFNISDIERVGFTLDKKITVDPSYYINKISGQAVAVIRAPAGGGALALSGDGEPIKADLYIYGGRFSAESVLPAQQIGTPGTMNNAITVGSYDWNRVFSYKGRQILVPDPLGQEITVGQLSRYSNPGFSRSGTIKPEIVAPGQYYHASYAKRRNRTGVDPFDPEKNPHGLVPDTSGNYILFNGTSAATPYTAGVIALILQKKPTLTLGQVRDLLKSHASRDTFTTALPNLGWGNGKLDMKAVRAILGSIVD